MMANTTSKQTFCERTRAAKKIMVLDLGFVGDTVHLLPALWMLRQACPKAELHVTVAEHVTSLMDCLPWVDRVWGYARFPKHATLQQNLRMVAGLRRERFDVLINLNGSDRSSWLSFFSGARERLGRMPRDGGPPLWRRMFTEIVQHHSFSEPVYLQKCRCLEKVGFPFTRPEFHVQIDPAHLQVAGITASDAGTYFHLSPFTTAEKKELPPQQLFEFIAAVENQFPRKRWVISGGPTDRERQKMESLLAGLRRKPWKVFAGELNLIQLAAVIQHSALHVSGDSGPLHLALMTGTPAVSWFRPNPSIKAWTPVGDKYRSVVGTTEAEATYLPGIDTGELVRAVSAVLSVPAPTTSKSALAASDG